MDPLSREERLACRELIGESPAFVAEKEKIPLIADCDVSVLVCGETGTGKELVARAIHYLSARAKETFLPVNCGAMPQELVENELFGHERGAFTGARNARPGLVEEAGGGTLLLDEVDSMPCQAQVKLLRFLQEKEFRRLGSNKTRTCDVRVIAATNTCVDEALASGRLRADLYYRLNVVPVYLPPLRRRRDDIPRLAHHFLRRFSREFGRRAAAFSDRTMEALVEHDWPGNVRELEHVVKRSVVLADEREKISVRHTLLDRAPGDESRPSFQQAKARVIERFERAYLEKMLTTHRGNISRAARAAQKNRRAFFELIRKHDIDVQRFR